jgi:hypothetical protein
MLAGCGKQSTPLVEVDVNETQVADGRDSDGLPLLAVPGPDESGNKSKVQRTAATGKSGPTLLPKGLFGKKGSQPEPLADDAADARKLPEKGSPEWLLGEIQRVRLLPLPHESSKDEETDDEEDRVLTPEQEKKLAQEIERNKGIRRERNLQIVKLAEECIQKTNKNPEQEQIFCLAVHHLLDARLQLALQGDNTSMEALYEADKVFYERNPKSESASEAALTLVNYAHANAVRYGRKDPRWLKEFSKTTQSYATRFPGEAPRAAPLLMAAARTCEMNGQLEEARVCYTVLGSKCGQTPQGVQAVGIMRRMQLKGQELKLAGPGIDGGDIDVKAMKGKMVLVVFWASNAQPFIQQIAKINEITTKYRKFVTVVGVNMDTEEKAVEGFVETYHLDWQQIFSPNRQQRGWNSPVAIHYGVNSLPTMWLLDPNGIVAETNLDASNLEAKIREVYEPFRTKNAPKK